MVPWLVVVTEDDVWLTGAVAGTGEHRAMVVVLNLDPGDCPGAEKAEGQEPLSLGHDPLLIPPPAGPALTPFLAHRSLLLVDPRTVPRPTAPRPGPRR